MINIEIREFKELDVTGSTIIEGFPGVGLVSSITAHYLIDFFHLDQICALDSDAFPPTSMIYATKPKFPARIYANEEKKIGVFLAEFTPPPPLARPIAKTLLEWCKKHNVKRIISTDGLPVEIKQSPSRSRFFEPKVYAIGSTEKTRNELKKAAIKSLDIGVIYGVAAVLLNEGRWNNFDVITILAEASSKFPDALAAAKIIEAIDLLIPGIRVETKPLYQEAKKLEDYLRTLRKQAESPHPDAYKIMYH